MQGFNMGRYIPPEALDAGLTSANAASGKGHALGSRARKITQGILTVRFEMPFAVWCTSCPQPTVIAQGVRFNAEKKKVGMYHSTPVLSFRMKHNACGGWLEVRTDPKNAEYVVHEGGKRRDYGEDRADGRSGPLGEILTEEERERRRNDAFAAFEGKAEEKQKGQAEGRRVEELLIDRARDWEDPWAANRRMRRSFRAERKTRHRNEQEKESVRDRLGLSIELLDETEADRRAAKLVSFGVDEGEGGQGEVAHKLSARQLFANTQKEGSIDRSKGRRDTRTTSTVAATRGKQSRARLADDIRDATRANLDPFNPHAPLKTGADRTISGLRKRLTGTDEASLEQPQVEGSKASGTMPAKLQSLVDYESE